MGTSCAPSAPLARVPLRLSSTAISSRSFRLLRMGFASSVFALLLAGAILASTGLEVFLFFRPVFASSMASSRPLFAGLVRTGVFNLLAESASFSLFTPNCSGVEFFLSLISWAFSETFPLLGPPWARPVIYSRFLAIPALPSLGSAMCLRPSGLAELNSFFLIFLAIPGWKAISACMLCKGRGFSPSILTCFFLELSFFSASCSCSLSSIFPLLASAKASSLE